MHIFNLVIRGISFCHVYSHVSSEYLILDNDLKYNVSDTVERGIKAIWVF
jgi:hypothetical protein